MFPVERGEQVATETPRRPRALYWAAALGIAAFAYRYARRHARDPRFAFGTGKLGDLAVLSADYLSCPPEEIKKIRSVLTVVDGKVASEAEFVAMVTDEAV